MQSVLGPIINVLTWVLDWLHGIGLTWGLSIIGLTIIVRLILFPLTWKQYKSAQEMQTIQPKIKELQKKYKNDRGKLQEETMKLYSEHHVNPFASCLPLILQMPIFISLYFTIRSEDAIKAATFLGIALGESSVVLLVVYVVTQIISTELMLVTQTDKTQKMIMRAMPIMFVFVLRTFPAGLFLYWITTNIWTVGQQLIIRRTMPKPDAIAAKAAAKPKKKSRFMQAVMESQSQAMKQREDTIAKKKGASASGGAKKTAGTAGAKKTAAGRKPPPGKGKVKAQRGGPGKAKRGAAGTAKPGASSKSKPATSKPSTSRKPKPGTTAGKPRAEQSGQGAKPTSSDGPAAG